LSDGIKETIVEAIWGGSLGVDGKRMLTHWFNHYLTETTSTTVLQILRPTEKSSLQTHIQLLTFIQLLKQHPCSPRKDLKILWQNGTPPTSETALDPDRALDLTVRVMFMAACRSSAAYNVITTGQFFKPLWKEEDTLEELIERIFPRYELNEGGGTETIRPDKFTAHYLYQYADVQVEWTNHLQDHLILQVTNDSKYLYVFGYAGYLETCSRTLACHNIDSSLSTRQALSL
jgi:hypothetical protein